MATITERRTTVVGVFDDRGQAEAAVNALRRAGFREDQIGIATRQAEGDQAETTTTGEQGTSNAATGAITGALAGAGLGGLVGLGIIAGIIPAIGPVIAGGTLAAILANAAGGAAIGSLLGTLTGAGIPEEEAHYYENEFQAGRTIVTVHADDRYEEALDIVHRNGGYDMHSGASRPVMATATEESVARSTTAGISSPGSAGATPTAAGITAPETVGATSRAAGTSSAQSHSRISPEGQSVQLQEEQLHAQKHAVETGEVRVGKEVHTEQRTLEVPVQREEVVIERHAPTGQRSAGDIQEGEEIRIPVKEEQVTVQKTPVVTEEVTVGKRAVQDTERVTGEVRKEELRVEKEGDVDVHGSAHSD